MCKRPYYNLVEVDPGTRVAVKSVGLLLGLVAIGCGGSGSTEPAPVGSTAVAARVSGTGDGTGVMSSVAAMPTTTGLADREYGSEPVGRTGSTGAAAPVPTTGNGRAASDTGPGQTAPVEDAEDGERRSVEVVAVPAPGGSVTVADGPDSDDQHRLEAVPIGSGGIVFVSGSVVTVPPGPPNDELVLYPVTRIVGDFAAKSVVASGTGLYFAQNMMYRHTISVLDHTKELVKTIDDSVDLREYGYDVSGDVYRGAPVEAAFSSDGSFAYVSNYRMYGPGYDPEAGGDSCSKDQGQDSFVFRIDATTLVIDHVYPVGPVPKHLATTPDDRLLLVSNWCGFDVSVIDLATHETIAVVDVGRYPRGIAITNDSKTAYVALMGSTGIAVIDLTVFSAADRDAGAAGEPVPTYLGDIGISPRHLVLSPDDKTLYVTLNGEDAVVAVDLASGLVVRRVQTGHAPRSMDISTDGTALYVVNYKSHTMSKIRARDFTLLQEFDTAPKPIGITYDSFNDEVWVSTYSGTIHVYAEGG